MCFYANFKYVIYSTTIYFINLILKFCVLLQSKSKLNVAKFYFPFVSSAQSVKGVAMYSSSLALLEMTTLESHLAAESCVWSLNVTAIKVAETFITKVKISSLSEPDICGKHPRTCNVPVPIKDNRVVEGRNSPPFYPKSRTNWPNSFRGW